LNRFRRRVGDPPPKKRKRVGAILRGWNLDQLPFLAAKTAPPLQKRERGRSPSLAPVRAAIRTASLTTNCSSCETFAHFGLEALHLDNCYCHQDLHHGAFHAASQPRFVTSLSQTRKEAPRALLLDADNTSPRQPRISRAARARSIFRVALFD